MKRLAALLLCSCASTLPHPSRDQPVAMCHVSCAHGAMPMFTRQHLCSGGASRYFTDFLAVGEHIERNVDGTFKIDDWVGRDGDYPKRDVETMPCSLYIQQVVASRSPSERGEHPGEDFMGRSH